MKAKFTNEYNELEKRIRRDTYQDIEKKLWERVSTIVRLLNNGETIFSNSLGKRCELLYKQRTRVRIKLTETINILEIIQKMH